MSRAAIKVQAVEKNTLLYTAYVVLVVNHVLLSTTVYVQSAVTELLWDRGPATLVGRSVELLQHLPECFVLLGSLSEGISQVDSN